MKGKRRLRRAIIAKCLTCYGRFNVIIGEAPHFIALRLRCQLRVCPFGKDRETCVNNHCPFDRDFVRRLSYPMTFTNDLDETFQLRSLTHHAEMLCPYCREVVLGRPDDRWLAQFGSGMKSLPSGYHVVCI